MGAAPDFALLHPSYADLAPPPCPGFGQLALRQVTAGVPASGIHIVYDQDGNLIAEANPSTGATLREYIWFPHGPEKWEPVFGSDHAGRNARPVAVVDDVDSTPVLYQVHVDHLDRPVMMTDQSKAIVWQAAYLPFGEVHAITGSASFEYLFPGQWFMLEAGLHYNWHRWYDASLGRYTQPDPLGTPDGPSRYAYAMNSPLMYVDPDGRLVWWAIPLALGAGNAAWQWYQNDWNWRCINPWEVATWAAMGTPISRVGLVAPKIIAQNGTSIVGHTAHGLNRAIGDGLSRAGASPRAILDALKNPRRIVRGVDELGRPYQVFHGQNARVVVNPASGRIVSVNPSSGAGVR